MRSVPQFVRHDGGRAAAGYKGQASDCVVRAIAIAAELPYAKVYEDLMEAMRRFGQSKRSRVAKRIRDKGASPREGVYDEVWKPYVEAMGWRWTPTMQIGSGCKVHLRAGELPGGRVIARVSKHVVAVIDGAIHDTHDCSRRGTRCVYGYFVKGE
jgi:hypothetical protein